MVKKFVFSVLISASFWISKGYSLSTEQSTFKQWFTGPLFTPMAFTPDPSHPAIEVTGGVLNQYGQYGSNWKLENVSDKWSIYNYIDLQLGFNSVLGMELIGAWTTNFRQNAHSTRIQDTTIRIGFQILNEIPGTWVPDFRILFEEVFPTGSYQKLNPNKNGTDLTGLGSFQTGLYLAFQKLFNVNEIHKFQMRFSAGYFVPASVHVEGFNAYGGGFDTNGRVFLGNYISLLTSGECNLNNRWAIAYDLSFQYNFKGRFSGKKGHLSSIEEAQVSSPEAVQLTLAPELEYTFTNQTGMLLGTWFSILGKNTPAFASVFLSILHVF